MDRASRAAASSTLTLTPVREEVQPVIGDHNYALYFVFSRTDIFQWQLHLHFCAYVYNIYYW